jgi:hypothetical protein
MWAPVSLGVSSKTLKHKAKFSHKLTDKSKRRIFSAASASKFPTRLLSCIILFSYVWYIIMQQNYINIRHLIVYYQVKDGKNRSLRHCKSSFIIIQSITTQCDTDLYRYIQAVNQLQLTTRISLLRKWVKSCSVKDNTLATSLTSNFKVIPCAGSLYMHIALTA